jgi:hypothetical protein
LISQAQAAQSSGNTASLQQICQQSRTLSVNSGNVNTGFANVCYSKRTMCSQTCETAYSKWQQRQSNCGSQCTLVNNTMAQLDSKKSTCNGYASLESQIRGQSDAAAEQARLAQICNDQSSLASTGDNSTTGNGGLTGALNQGLASGTAALIGSAPSGSASGPASAEQEFCSLNPTAPSCYVAPQFTGDSDGGGGAVGSSSGGSSGNYSSFNVGADNNIDDGNAYQGAGGYEAQASAAAPIPNGGGGGVPGGEGGSAAVASASSADAQNLPAMLGDGVNPNILHGENGGGGYSANQAAAAEGSGFGNSGSGFSFPNAAGKKGDPNYRGMDLKKYLPGGARDPSRGLAGLSAFYPDIGPKHISFFNRVSARIQSLCKLKRLLDCQ